MSASSAMSTKGSVRERLLAAADELFYRDGVQSVGVDRVIDTAGVAKASLYRTFGTKERLVAAYLAARHQKMFDYLLRAVDKKREPRDRLLAIFDAQAQWINRRQYRGCPFARASAEPSVGALVLSETVSYRDDIRTLLTTLGSEAGAADAAALGLQLSLLYHGVTGISERGQLRVATAALRSAAETLIDAATNGGR
jgi:AcrR family transcriptional regulator